MAPDQEARLRDLEINFAAERATTAAALEHLTSAVTTLNATMLELRDTINKGEGAIAGVKFLSRSVIILLTLLATAFGSLISWAMTHFLR